MSYLRRPSALHAAGAAVAILWCGALLGAALASANPLWLATLVIVVGAAGELAGARKQTLACLRFAIPLAVVICLINALVTRSGLTVIWRFGDLPVVGQTNVTLQATVYGAVLGLRAVVIVQVATLYSVAVDPDEVLALFRRLSFRSALSAAIATRMVPVLISDSHRLADAQRCRPGTAAGRVQLLRASTAGVVDRALDIAATLEVRGYALTHRHRSARRLAWRERLRGATRQDLGFLASACVVLVTSVLGGLLDATSFNAYPRLTLLGTPLTVVACAVLAGATLAPFLDRRGVG